MKKFVLVLVSLFLCLAAAESASRIIIANDALFSRIATNDDSTWRLRWVKRHAGGQDMYYFFDEYDPLLGWRLQAGLKTDQKDGINLTTNSRGVRALREYSYEKPAGVKRILVVGDSFTFGEEVDDTQTYPYLLEQLLPNTEVINLGIHGYATDQMLLYLKKEGAKYQPDIVLVGFLHEDMDRNLLSFRDYAKPKYELKNGTLVLTHVPIPKPSTLIRTELFRPKLLDVARMFQNKRAWQSGQNQSDMENITRALLVMMATTITDMGATPIFAYLPTSAESVTPAGNHTAGEQLLLAFCKDKELDCINLRPVYTDAAESGTVLKSSGHWDAQSHRIAAGALADFLQDLLLVQ